MRSLGSARDQRGADHVDLEAEASGRIGMVTYMDAAKISGVSLIALASSGAFGDYGVNQPRDADVSRTNVASEVTAMPVPARPRRHSPEVPQIPIVSMPDSVYAALDFPSPAGPASTCPLVQQPVLGADGSSPDSDSPMVVLEVPIPSAHNEGIRRVVTWSMPIVDPGLIAGFNVFRANDEGPFGAPLNARPVQATSFVDDEVIEASNVRYAVQIVLQGERSAVIADPSALSESSAPLANEYPMNVALVR